MISMVIMTVGLVSLLGVFGLAMASTQTSQQNGISKQLANEALEGVLTARETANRHLGSDRQYRFRRHLPFRFQPH